MNVTMKIKDTSSSQKSVHVETKTNNSFKDIKLLIKQKFVKEMTTLFIEKSVEKNIEW